MICQGSEQDAELVHEPKWDFGKSIKYTSQPNKNFSVFMTCQLSDMHEEIIICFISI